MKELDTTTLRKFEKYKKDHPEFFPEDTPLEKQHAYFLATQERREQEKEQKTESFHKLDQAVDKKVKEKSERTKRDHIEQEAIRILCEGDPVSYLYEQFLKIHNGDKIIFYGLLASIGAQLCLSTEGLHIGLTGESTKGKTDSCKSVFYLLPDEFKMKGSFTNKSFFYHLKNPGTVIFFDDAANIREEIKDMIKQSTSAFQEVFIHRTVDRLVAITKELPPRISYWVTTVGGNFEMQFLNRQLNMGVDDSATLDDIVKLSTLERYRKGEIRYAESEGVLICREIFRILKEKEPVIVKIPFADKIHWNQPKNRRNLPMFLDSLCAYAAINQFQRLKDEGGAIIASTEDFNQAKILWTGISQEQVGKLTKDDLRVLNCIKEKGEKSHMGIFSIPRQVAKRELGFSDAKMHLIINGKDCVGGLREKVEGFDLVKGSKTVELMGGGTRTVHCDELEYDGSLDMFGQFNDLVWIVE